MTTSVQICPSMSEFNAVKGTVDRLDKGSGCPWPVGSVTVFVNDVNPNSEWPGTSWQKIEGVFLLASSGSHPLGQTGGEESHTLTVNEMPSHNHAICEEFGARGDGAYPPGPQYAQISGTDSGTKVWNSWPISSAGGNWAHNNMPPFLAVHMWKRVS